MIIFALISEATSLTERLTDWDVSQVGEVGLILLSFLAIDIDGIC